MAFKLKNLLLIFKRAIVSCPMPKSLQTKKQEIRVLFSRLNDETIFNHN